MVFAFTCKNLIHTALLIAYLCHTIPAFSPSSGDHLLILGFGRVGKEIAQNAFQQSLFTTITGTVRNLEVPLFQNEVNLIPFQNEHIQPILPQCSHILITLPPPREQDDELNAVLNSMDQYFPQNGWMGLISTTGVYGNHNGAWVTEESTCHATSESARLFLQWEKDFCEKCQRNQHQLAIFRCAGIYGPGRSALHTAFKDPPATERPSSSQFVTNRIHTHDLSRAVLSCMEQRNEMSEWKVFNLADDLPESRSVVLGYARDMLTSAGCIDASIRAPEEESNAQPTSNLSNRRMKDILLDGQGLLYPTYKEGLEQIFRLPSELWWNQQVDEV